jgi:FkbM family methyltransferase
MGSLARAAVGPLVRAGRGLVRRTGYAVVWRNPRGYSLPTHLMAVFRRLGVNCVVDVGGHFGEYGSGLRRYGYRGRIVTFEPLRENVERLLATRGDDPDWRVVNAALGAEEGSGAFNVSADTALSSFLEAGPPLTEEQGHGIAVAERREVEVRTLDGVWDECVAGLSEPRVFLKLDTQGWDLEVLRGAERSLPRLAGLQSEVSVLPLYEGMTPYLEHIGRLASLGLELSGVYPVAYRDLSVVELDVVFVRPE